MDSSESFSAGSPFILAPGEGGPRAESGRGNYEGHRMKMQQSHAPHLPDGRTHVVICITSRCDSPYGQKQFIRQYSLLAARSFV